MDLGVLSVGCAVVAFVGPLVLYFEKLHSIANVLIWPLRLFICVSLFTLERLTDSLLVVDDFLDNPLVKLLFITAMWLVFPNYFLKFWLTVPIFLLMGMVVAMLRPLFKSDSCLEI